MSDNKPVENMLQEMTDRYRCKVSEQLQFIVQIDILPSEGSWHICVEPRREVSLRDGKNDKSRFTLQTTKETLQDMYTGKLAPITAMARARMADITPMDVIPGKDVKLIPGSEDYIRFLHFIQRFFNRFEPERTLLGSEHARKVHGGNVVGLFYGQGIRSAWYQINKGERLNEPGDTNPFPQAFIFVSGVGFAQIGTKTIPVRAGEAYNIPQGSEHMVWTESEEPLELIFLAWGEGA
jgi:mannose-6-phosphate isomerase-like protein (cupin superfamily)